MNNPIGVAARGKGVLNAARRALVISRRYGFTPRKMDAALSHFAKLLAEYYASATFPIPASVVARNPGVIEKYQGPNIEYAVHGYYHVDHKQLSLETQLAHFSSARKIFESRGLTSYGFRAPYLRGNSDTLTAVIQTGFSYETTQGIVWDVLNGNETDSFKQVLPFYGAISAKDYLAVPRWKNGLVEIPYCLPDDESLIDRLQFDSPQAMNIPWLAILEETYRRGELFSLGLHPERIYLCETPLRQTLKAARQLFPSVWLARLDVIASWWVNRTNSQVTIRDEGQGWLHIDIEGPQGLTILTRNINTKAESKDWDGVYCLVNENSFTVQSERRPFIGVSPTSDEYLSSFLSQQGYIVETAQDDRSHSFFFHREKFERNEEKPLIEGIESSAEPLVRLGRWPDGARSAMCVTGDIDALTIWDYYSRFIGK